MFSECEENESTLFPSLDRLWLDEPIVCREGINKKGKKTEAKAN